MIFIFTLARSFIISLAYAKYVLLFTFFQRASVISNCFQSHVSVTKNSLLLLCECAYYWRCCFNETQRQQCRYMKKLYSKSYRLGIQHCLPLAVTCKMICSHSFHISSMGLVSCFLQPGDNRCSVNRMSNWCVSDSGILVKHHILAITRYSWNGKSMWSRHKRGKVSLSGDSE